MSRKTFNLVSACIGAAETLVIAIVTYCNPGSATAINAATVVIGTAAIEACSYFVKE